MFRPVFAALLLFFAVSVAGLSGTIWNNGPPNGVDEWTINDSIVEADDFVLAAPTRITRINFSAASDVNTAVIALNYSLYSSTAGLPATLVDQGAAQNLVATPAGMVARAVGHSVSLLRLTLLRYPFAPGATGSRFTMRAMELPSEYIGIRQRIGWTLVVLPKHLNPISPLL
jgi:hypothetical protein